MQSIDSSVHFYIESFDGDHYICKKYNKLLKRKQLSVRLCSVNLMLLLFIRKLVTFAIERIDVSRRILFKKVTIIPKGKSQKNIIWVCM